jgi:L-malate glycosyltransferase
MPKILFYTPYFGYSGSELILLKLIKKLRGLYQITLVSDYYGQLKDQLDKTIPYYSFENYLGKRNLLQRVKQHFNKEDLFLAFLNKILIKEQPDLVYANTIMSSKILEQATFHNIKSVLHTHEMTWALQYLQKKDLEVLANFPFKIIACSDSSAEIFRSLGVGNKVNVVFNQVQNKINLSQEAQLLRDKLQIPKHAFIWMMAGNLDINKNPECFIDLAMKLQHENICFLWIGGDLGSAIGYYVQQRTNFLGLTDKVKFIGKKTIDYFKFLSLANGFILTSRYDSNPTVVHEALALKIPVVGFNSGGIMELAEKYSGIRIGESMSEVIQFMKNAMASPEYASNYRPDEDLFISQLVSEINDSFGNHH